MVDHWAWEHHYCGFWSIKKTPTKDTARAVVESWRGRRQKQGHYISRKYWMRCVTHRYAYKIQDELPRASRRFSNDVSENASVTKHYEQQVNKQWSVFGPGVRGISWIRKLMLLYTTGSPSSLYEPHKEHNMASSYKGLYGIFSKISMKVVKSENIQ